MAIEKVSLEIDTNVDEVEKKLQEIDRQIEALKKQRANIELNFDGIEDAQLQLDQIDTQISALSTSKILLQADINEIADAGEALADLVQTVDVLDMSEAKINVDDSDVQDGNETAKEFDQTLEMISRKNRRVNVDSDEVEQAKEEADGVDDSLNKVTGKTHRINVSSNLNEIGSTIDGIGNKILGLFNPLSSGIAKIAGQFSVFKLLDTAINTVTSSLGGAISRFDTLNNYPRVMEGLGHSFEDANASVQKLSDNIQGLPTTLDEIVQNTQQIASITGDLDRATDTALGLNAAFLASGASTEQVNSGTQQFINILSTGKVGLQSFRTLMRTMPVALTEVANSFGYVGKTAQTDLYDALSDGIVTIDDFTDAIINLGTEGGKLEELARKNSEGIGTSFTNLRNNVVIGLTNVLTAFDDLLTEITGKNIAQTLDSFKLVIKSFFAFIVDNIDQARPFIEGAIALFGKIGDYLKNFDWGAFKEGLGEGINSLKTALQTLLRVGTPILEWIKGLITSFGGGSFEKGLGKLPALLLKIAAGAKVLGGALKLFSKFNLGSIFGGKKSGSGSGDSGTFGGVNWGSIANQLKNVAVIYSIIKIIQEVAKTIALVDDILPQDFTGVTLKFAQLGVLFASASAFILVLGKIVDADTEAAVKGAAAIAVIAAELVIIAVALEQVNQRVPNDFNNIIAKLGVMALAITGIAVIAGVIGGILATDLGLEVLAKGAAGIAVLAIELMLVAESLQQINDKVPSDFSDVAKKMASIAIAIGGIAAIAGVIGGILSTGIGLAVLAAGAAGVAVFAVELILVAEAIKQLDEKVPSDIDSVSKKIENIVTVIQELNKANLGTLLDLFNNAVGALNTGVIIATLGEFIIIAEELNILNEVNVPKNVVKKIEEIQEVVNSIEGSGVIETIRNFIGLANNAAILGTITIFVEIGEKLNELVDLKVKYGTAKAAIGYIQDILTMFTGSNIFEVITKVYETVNTGIIYLILSIYTGIAERLNELVDMKVKYGTAKTAIGHIQDILDMFSGSIPIAAITKVWEGVNTWIINKILEIYISIAEKINELVELKVKYGTAKAAIGHIQDIINMFTGSNPFEAVGTAFEAIDNFIIISSFDSFIEIAERLKTLAGINFKFGDVANKIKEIQQITEILGGDNGFWSKVTGWFKDAVDNASFSQAQESLRSVVDIARSLEQISYIRFDAGKVKQRIQDINEAIELLGNGDLADLVGSIIKKYELDQVVDSFKSLFDIAETIQQFGSITFNAKWISSRIQGVLDIIGMLGGASIEELWSSLLKSWQLKDIRKSFISLQEIIDDINAIAQQSVLTTTAKFIIQQIKEVLDELLTLQEYENLTYLEGIIRNIRDLIIEINGLATEFTSVGKDYGDGLFKGYLSANVNRKIIKEIDTLIRRLRSKATKFRDIGKKYGDELRMAFIKALAGMEKAVDSQISAIAARANQFTTIGRTMGTNLTQAFNAAIGNFTTEFQRQINRIQNMLNTLSIQIREINMLNPSGNYFSNGGEVQYRVTGGTLFKPKGTDRIPAMLTKGEYVQQKSAVDMFGLNFMDRVNQMDVEGAFRAMVNRFNIPSAGNTNIQNIVNNNQVVNHNNKINQNVSTNNQNFASLRLGRGIAGCV